MKLVCYKKPAFKNRTIEATENDLVDALCSIGCTIANLNERPSVKIRRYFTDKELERFRQLEASKNELVSKVEVFASEMSVKYENALAYLKKPEKTEEQKTKILLNCFDGTVSDQIQGFVDKISKLQQMYGDFHDDLDSEKYRMNDMKVFIAKNIFLLCCLAGVVALVAHVCLNPAAIPIQALVAAVTFSGVLAVRIWSKDEVQRGMQFLKNVHHRLQELKNNLQEFRDLVNKGIHNSDVDDDDIKEDCCLLLKTLVKHCGKVIAEARKV